MYASFFYSAVYIEQIRLYNIICSRFRHIIIIIIVKAYLNVLFSCQICMFICMYVYMYVCMHVCTKSFLKTTTNSSCVCTHLANKADSDSDSDSDLSLFLLLFLLPRHLFTRQLMQKKLTHIL